MGANRVAGLANLNRRRKMKITTSVTLAAAFLLAASAASQTHVSGTITCGTPQTQTPVEIGDRAGHTLTIAQFHCTWTRPIEIAGQQSGALVTTESMESMQNRFRERGYDVIEWSGGDKSVDSFIGHGLTNGQNFVSGAGRWRFTNGTGKLEGIKGGGTYSCKPSASGVVCDIEADYTLPAK
jgi:hypothetical protein